MKFVMGMCHTMALVVGLGLCALGCARAANDTSSFAIQDDLTVNAPFEETWQAMKSVLREQGYDLYTRDKRGIFVAYSETNRRLLRIQPHRMKYTIEMAPVSSDETKVYIETIKQVYGTTLMTYPDWHDRQAEDNTASLEILNALQAKLSGADVVPVANESDTAVQESTETEMEEVEATPATI